MVEVGEEPSMMMLRGSGGLPEGSVLEEWDMVAFDSNVLYT